MNRHLTTADQSGIRKAYLVSVMATRKMDIVLACINLESGRSINFRRQEYGTIIYDYRDYTYNPFARRA